MGVKDEVQSGRGVWAQQWNLIVTYLCNAHFRQRWDKS
jgi:hypothetical protein